MWKRKRSRSLVRPLLPSTILASHLQDGIYLLLGGIDSYLILKGWEAIYLLFVWQISVSIFSETRTLYCKHFLKYLGSTTHEWNSLPISQFNHNSHSSKSTGSLQFFVNAYKRARSTDKVGEITYTPLYPRGNSHLFSLDRPLPALPLPFQNYLTHEITHKITMAHLQYFMTSALWKHPAKRLIRRWISVLPLRNDNQRGPRSYQQ